MLLTAACATSNKSVTPVRESRAPEQQARQQVGSYGFHPEDPVRVGWGNEGLMAFLDLLRGPEGQRVAWRRLGPSQGMEVFEVTYDGLAAPVNLYLDPMHGGAIHAPAGFTIEGITSREPLPPTERPQVIEL
ncbi:fibril protein [Pyxidicoccus parkwayensis]|uniref:Fibril protein n=1 Tax=Pyxidicoccus parkwayensis TaxID=2813578 RepID=A0ABX7PD96_9BACT|nr:fibril protein [Pyxidicoccus parkwaysis]